MRSRPGPLLLLASILVALTGCRARTAATTPTSTASFVPALVLDLDGDGSDDAVQPVIRDGSYVLEVAWAHGATERVTSVPVYEDGDLFETTTDFSWLVHWTPLPNTGDGYDVPILTNTVHFSLPAALGDAALCSSNDVAVLLYYTPVGFRMEHLGF
jgi:hypothetical protein